LLTIFKIAAVARGWTIEGLEFESQQHEEFSLLHIVHTGSGVHLATVGFFHGDKAA
jgi:hypothetical protein